MSHAPPFARYSDGGVTFRRPVPPRTGPAELIDLAIIGDGRMGRALSQPLRASGLRVSGPHGRCSDGAGAQAVLLCVPDGAIAEAAGHVPPAPGRLVGHCSGATTLEPLAPHADRFSFHPLMTVTGPGTDFTGAGAAVAGSTDAASGFARRLAETLAMRPFTVADEDRAAYHAAASVASNYLLALEAAAERLLPEGTDRAVLVPLVRQTVENWAELGAAQALTGPIARGDEATVERQRAAVATKEPGMLRLFDTLADETRRLAQQEVPA